VVGPQEGGVVVAFSSISAGIAVVHQGVPAGLDRRPLRPGQRLFLLMRLSGGPAPGAAPGAGEGAAGSPPRAAAFDIVLVPATSIAPPITAAAPAGRSAPPRAAIAAAPAARHALLHGREELRAAVARPRPDVRRRGGAERIELRPQSRRRLIVAAAALLRGAGIGPGTCGHGGGLLVARPAAGVGTRPVRRHARRRRRGAGLRLLRPHWVGFPVRQSYLMPQCSYLKSQQGLNVSRKQIK